MPFLELLKYTAIIFRKSYSREREWSRLKFSYTVCSFSEYLPVGPWRICWYWREAKCWIPRSVKNDAIHNFLILINFPNSFTDLYWYVTATFLFPFQQNFSIICKTKFYIQKICWHSIYKNEGIRQHEGIQRDNKITIKEKSSWLVQTDRETIFEKRSLRLVAYYRQLLR